MSFAICGSESISAQIILVVEYFRLLRSYYYYFKIKN